ncbi:hypothetical protein LXL04_006351 [Taraxacum kok-saghyz]
MIKQKRALLSSLSKVVDFEEATVPPPVGFLLHPAPSPPLSLLHYLLPLLHCRRRNPSRRFQNRSCRVQNQDACSPPIYKSSAFRHHLLSVEPKHYTGSLLQMRPPTSSHSYEDRKLQVILIASLPHLIMSPRNSLHYGVSSIFSFELKKLEHFDLYTGETRSTVLRLYPATLFQINSKSTVQNGKFAAQVFSQVHIYQYYFIVVIPSDQDQQNDTTINTSEVQDGVLG